MQGLGDICKWEQVRAVVWDWVLQPILIPDLIELWDIKSMSENFLWKCSGRSILFRIWKLAPEEKENGSKLSLKRAELKDGKKWAVAALFP